MGRQANSNWLDPLRLLFAALVVFHHSFGLITDRPDEPFRHLFGVTGVGEIAVCGFFILSGYLISRSWTSRPDLISFIRNRSLRIAPAFVVAFLASLMIAGAIGAADAGLYYRSISWVDEARALIQLQVPPSPPTFAGLRMPLVNGSMWTISYEFACYLLAPLVLYRRWTLISAWAVAALLTVTLHDTPARFFLMFFSGSIYWTFGLKSRSWVVVMAAVAAVALMFFAHAWALGLAIFGAYALLSLGLKSAPFRIPDISYGLYLYGWPVQMVMIWWGLDRPWLLFPPALAVSALFGAASWFGIERYALRLKSRSRSPAETATVISDPVRA